MGHLHTSSECLCCSAMGVRLRPNAYQQPQTKQERITVEGMDHVYDVETVKVEVVNVDQSPNAVAEAVTVNQSTQPIDGSTNASVEALKTIIEEQSQKLESASYRIGYLEAQLNSKEEQIKLIEQKSVRRSFFNWMFGR